MLPGEAAPGLHDLARLAACIIAIGVTFGSLARFLFSSHALGLTFASGVVLIAVLLVDEGVDPIWAGLALAVGINASTLLSELANQRNRPESYNRFGFLLYAAYLYAFLNLTYLSPGLKGSLVFIASAPALFFVSWRVRDTLTSPLIILTLFATLTLIVLSSADAGLIAFASAAFVVGLIFYEVFFRAWTNDEREVSALRKFSNALLLFTVISMMSHFVFVGLGNATPRKILSLATLIFVSIQLGFLRASRIRGQAATPIQSASLDEQGTLLLRVCFILTAVDVFLLTNFYASLSDAPDYGLAAAFPLMTIHVILLTLSQVIKWRIGVKGRHRFALYLTQFWAVFVALAVVNPVTDMSIIDESVSGMRAPVTSSTEAWLMIATGMILLAQAVSFYQVRKQIPKGLPWWVGFASPKIAVFVIRGWRSFRKWLSGAKIVTPFIVVGKLVLSAIGYLKGREDRIDLGDVQLAAALWAFFSLSVPGFQNLMISSMTSLQTENAHATLENYAIVLSNLIAGALLVVLGTLQNVMIARFAAIGIAVLLVAFALFGFPPNMFAAPENAGFSREVQLTTSTWVVAAFLMLVIAASAQWRKSPGS